jgi:hypothetical protein
MKSEVTSQTIIQFVDDSTHNLPLRGEIAW